MTTLSLRLPDSLHRQLKELAERDGVSINQFVALAVAEKVSVLSTEDYLEQRAKRGNRTKFRKVLAKVPDVEPEAIAKRPRRRSTYAAGSVAGLSRRSPGNPRCREQPVRRRPHCSPGHPDPASVLGLSLGYSRAGLDNRPEWLGRESVVDSIGQLDECLQRAWREIKPRCSSRWSPIAPR